jgi:hypothetical protein
MGTEADIGITILGNLICVRELDARFRKTGAAFLGILVRWYASD